MFEHILQEYKQMSCNLSLTAVLLMQWNSPAF